MTPSATRRDYTGMGQIRYLRPGYIPRLRGHLANLPRACVFAEGKGHA